MAIDNFMDLNNYITLYKDIFCAVRVVDPRNKEVIKLECIEDLPSGIKCFEYWKNNQACSNCISKIVVDEKRTVTKIEYKDNKAFFVIAKPIVYQNRIYSLEMLKSIDEIETINELDEIKQKKNEKVISGLKKSLMFDDLTGIYNRRFINKMLPMEITDAAEKGIVLAVIMIDVDNFKNINDKYGHIAGDNTLKSISETIDSRIRKDFDWVARYGGDEFIIVLKNADKLVANKIREQIQKALYDNGILINGTKVKLTLSCGIKIIEPGTMNFQEVLQSIDENLHKAKNEGKNTSFIS